MPYTQPYGGFDKIKAAVPYALDKGVTPIRWHGGFKTGAAVKHTDRQNHQKKKKISTNKTNKQKRKRKEKKKKNKQT